MREILKEMDLPKDVVNDFDKAHRLGKVKESNGKKHQDIIVRFKSHSSRYKVFHKRKTLKHVSISANLTKNRSKLLFDAIQVSENNIDDNEWGFVYANEHGDLLFRLKQKFNGKQYFSFDSLESFKKQLKDIGFIN